MSEPARKRYFAATSASIASPATTVTRSEVRLRRLTRARVDQMVELAAAALPARAGRGPEVASPPPRQLERQRAVGGLDADGPAAAADGDVAAGVDEARTGDGEDLRGTFGRVALADAAEVEADAGVELDRARP